MAEPGVAVIGTGFIGPVHVEALRRIGVPIVGILGSSPERSRQGAAALGVQRAFDSLDELLHDEAVQVVHITSPNGAHFAQARQSLLAGRHVVCEKPLAMTSLETSDLVAIAKQSGKVAAVNYNIRFYPLTLEARERVARGDIGKVMHITGGYVQDWLLKETDFNWRVLTEQAGETRAVGDIGTHWMDLVTHICDDEIESVCSDLATFLPVRQRPTGSVQTFTSGAAAPTETIPINIKTEDYGSILLRFKSGARGSLTVSQVAAGRKNCLRFEIAGAKGSVAWNGEQPNELWLGNRDRPNELLIKDPSLMAEGARGFASYPGGHAEGFPDTFKQLYRAVYVDIRAGRPSVPASYPTFEDGHREVLLCEAIVKSHREQRWVTLG
jgi:predicted dehydrogenase